ncbi:MAG TPA: radical SAM protein [Thermoanaerobaculia bacterium]|nr:radical SAM protein [Thermoanaerobaculia bacterium]
MYVLADYVKYRREGFGGIVLDLPSKTTRFYNVAAAQLLEAASETVSQRELNAFRQGDHQPRGQFLQELLSLKLLRSVSRRTTSLAPMYFTDVASFPESHLFAPLGVELEITLKCYRKCVYCCYESEPLVNTSGELTTAQWCSTLLRLRDNGVFYVRFTGGDPFVRDDFLEILRFADDLGLIVSVGSDLTILEEEHVTALAECTNLLMVQTTLDGATERSADALRGPGNWRKVVRGLRMLAEQGVPVVVGTVLHRGNIGEIGEIAKLVANCGATGYHLAPLYSAGRGRELEHLIPTNADLMIANQAFREVIEAGVVAAADPAWTDVVKGLEAAELDHAWDDQPYLVRSPDRLLRIDPWGRCYSSIQVKEVVGDAVYVGNMLENSLHDIWHNAPLLSAMRSFETSSTIFGEVVDIRRFAVRLKEAANG